jgi:Flp pilus assembly protein TadG
MFQHLLASCRHAIARDRKGVAAVEFAVVAPVLITLLAGAANIGFAVDHAIALANAARAGAQHIIAQPGDAAGARTAAQAVLPGSTAAVSPMACTCPASVSAATGGSAVELRDGKLRGQYRDGALPHRHGHHGAAADPRPRRLHANPGLDPKRGRSCPVAAPGTAGPRRDEGGVVAVEFAIVGMIFFMLLLGAVDLARYQFIRQSLGSMAQEAARTALLASSAASVQGGGCVAPPTGAALRTAVTTPRTRRRCWCPRS